MREKYLVIERTNCTFTERSKKDFDLDKVQLECPIVPFNALLGLIELKGEKFIVIVTQFDEVGDIYKDQMSKIYRIKEAKFVSLRYGIEVKKYDGEIRNLIFGISSYLQQGFFFSYHYDLTNSMQRAPKSCSAGLTLFNKTEKEYVWNYEICKNIDSSLHRWLTPVIQGYVGIEEDEINSKSVKLVLISRRSYKHTGTRYNARGIDDEGNTANCVETEQILFYNNSINSFVQLRGSVPIFWTQEGLVFKIKLTRTPEMSFPSFSKHFDRLIKIYKRVAVFNLLSSHSKGEAELTKGFEANAEIYKKKENTNFKYCYFDFHRERSAAKDDAIMKLIESWWKLIEYYGFYREGFFAREQIGVIRTNCLDSLDRTNAFQSKIAWKIFLEQIKQHGVHTETYFGRKEVPIAAKLRDLWAENGNMLSIQYSGTESTTESITKNSKEGFLGKISHGFRSINRYFINTFTDEFKQQCIDAFLNRECAESEEKEIEEEKDVFEVSSLSLFIGSWNVGGVIPPLDLDISSWLTELNKESADIAVFGLQEIAQFHSATALMNHPEEAGKRWDHIINTQLYKLEGRQGYEKVQSQIMNGLYITVYAKKDIMDSLSEVWIAKMKTGILGVGPNKGAIIMRFMIGRTSIALMNCHLSHGKTNIQKRFYELRTIYNYSIREIEKEMQVSKHDLKFLFGDLNFRLDLERTHLNFLLKHNNFKEMLNHDQLWGQYHQYNFLPSLEESTINFKPTYKYKKGTTTFDIEKRLPAWCDRILWDSNDQIKCIKYSSVDKLSVSDHKPIFGIFQINIKKEIGKAHNYKIFNEHIPSEDKKENFLDAESSFRVGTMEGYDVIASNDLDPTESLGTSFVDLGADHLKVDEDEI